MDSEQSEEVKDEKPLASPKQSASKEDIMEFPKSLLKPLHPSQMKPSEKARSPFTGSSDKYEAKDDGLIDQNFEHNAFSILYNTVVGYTDSTGRRLAQPFIRLPNKRFNSSVNSFGFFCLFETSRKVDKSLRATA